MKAVTSGAFLTDALGSCDMDDQTRISYMEGNHYSPCTLGKKKKRGAGGRENTVLRTRIIGMENHKPGLW